MGLMLVEVRQGSSPGDTPCPRHRDSHPGSESPCPSRGLWHLPGPSQETRGTPPGPVGVYCCLGSGASRAMLCCSGCMSGSSAVSRAVMLGVYAGLLCHEPCRAARIQTPGSSAAGTSPGSIQHLACGTAVQVPARVSLTRGPGKTGLSPLFISARRQTDSGAQHLVSALHLVSDRCLRQSCERSEAHGVGGSERTGWIPHNRGRGRVGGILRAAWQGVSTQCCCGAGHRRLQSLP